MKNLENFGVQELNAKGIKETNGGDLGLGLAVAGALIYLYNEGGDFIDGISEGYHRARYGSGAGGSW